MKETLNARVKHREEFRPFAPACLQERAAQFFDLDGDAPFMLLIAQAKPGVRKVVPAVVHEDGTARVQTVSRQANPDLYQIIAAFEKRTSIPMLVNTSFNVNGETIVDTAQDALESFGFMDIDYLALGPYWISKAENQERFAPLANLSQEEYLELRRHRFRQRQLGPLAEIDIAKFADPFFDVDRPIDEYFDRMAQRPTRRDGHPGHGRIPGSPWILDPTTSPNRTEA